MSQVELLKVPEVAVMLRVSKQTVYRLIQDGELETIWVRGSVRIFASSLIDYMTPARSVTA